MSCVACDFGCNPQGSLSLPIQTNLTLLSVVKYNWTLKNEGGYNPKKVRAQWVATATRTESGNTEANLEVYIIAGVLNEGNGDSDLGNVVVNLVLADGTIVKTFVRSLLPTNGSQVGNFVGGSFTASDGTWLSVSDQQGNDIFSAADPNYRLVKSKEYKYLVIKGYGKLPLDFKEETRLEVYMTFGNAAVGCEVIHGDNIKYKGGDVAYNDVGTIMFQGLLNDAELNVYGEKAVLSTDTSMTRVIKGGGSYTRFTTDIGIVQGTIGYEEVDGTVIRNTCVTPCPEVQDELRQIMNTVNLSIQPDSYLFNLPVEVGSNKTTQFLFSPIQSGVYLLAKSIVNVSKEVCLGDSPKFQPLSASSMRTDEEFLRNMLRSQGGLIALERKDVEGSVSVIFTEVVSLQSILQLISSTEGKSVEEDLTDPITSPSGKLLASLLWLHLTILSVPNELREEFLTARISVYQVEYLGQQFTRVAQIIENLKQVVKFTIAEYYEALIEYVLVPVEKQKTEMKEINPISQANVCHRLVGHIA